MRHQTQLAQATDCVVTNFFCAHTTIGLITRKNMPFLGKYCFPGGHFDPGVWDFEKQSFVKLDNIGCDESLEETSSRELSEETHLTVDLKEWKFLMNLTAPDRDPRSDCRRISTAFWKDFGSTEALEKAIPDDDADKWYIVPLMKITKIQMGFDHWLVIDHLQKLWTKFNSIWTKKESSYIHECQGALDNPVCIKFTNDKAFIEVQPFDYGPIVSCPFCGADLTIGPLQLRSYTC